MMMEQPIQEERLMSKLIFPLQMPKPCGECGRQDWQGLSATEEADEWFEAHPQHEDLLHHFLSHDYMGDFADAFNELLTIGLDNDGAVLHVLAELATSYYGLALRHVGEEKVVL